MSLQRSCRCGPRGAAGPLKSSAPLAHTSRSIPGVPVRFRILFAALFLAWGPVASASKTSTVSARVFLDDNADGRWSPGERGAPDVGVSDGVTVWRTGAKGEVTLAAEDDALLFVIKPAGFSLGVRPDGLPDFWRVAKANAEVWQVPLIADAAKPPFSVRVFGDPQPKNEADVGYYARDIVANELRLPRAQLGLSLGDIVHGNLPLFPAMIAATAAMKTPWLHVSGNHDRDYGAENDPGSLATFRSYFGPDTFAWEESGLALVVLDNVIHQPGTGAPARYVGGLREEQFAFLASYLATVPSDVLLVLSMHIPLFDADVDPAVDTFRDADRQRLFAMLQARRHVLVLSSHTHTQGHHWHSRAEGWQGAEPLHEYNVGAACGAFWTGVKNASGIPDTRMADGTPNGFATLQVLTEGGYSLRWHAAGEESDPAFALHAPKVLRQGAWPGFGIYANVWMGDATSRVEYRIGEGNWLPMQRVDRADPELLAINAADDAAPELRGYDRAPEARTSPHLWRAALRTDLPIGEHRVEVRVFDRWRGEQRQTVTYRLVEAQP